MPQNAGGTLNDEEAIVFVMLVIMASAIGLIWIAVTYRRRLREMEHRERLAMIERGIVPPPETDPAGFESRAGLPAVPASPGGVRSRSAGIMLIGLGFALMLLITFVADAGEVGVGVGGAFVVLGGAFLFNGMLLARQSPQRPEPRTGSAARFGGGAEPPNVGP